MRKVLAIWTLCLLATVSAWAQGFTEVSRFFFNPESGKVGVPYVASTLEPETMPEDLVNTVEPLIVRLDAVDCTTFVEYASAAILSHLPVPDPNDSLFLYCLQSLRYRGGVRGNYTTRKHYFSEWILDAEKQELLTEVTRTMPGAVPLQRTIDFMSKHVNAYPQLKACPKLLPGIYNAEHELSSQTVYYIPSSQISKAYKSMRHGDIVAFVTETAGLDIQHVGFVWYPDPKRHAPQLFHASSTLKSVTLDPSSLQAYAQRVKNCKGIRIVRLNNQK